MDLNIVKGKEVETGTDTLRVFQDGGPDYIRKFANSGIQAAIDRATADLHKSGKNAAVVAVVDEHETALAAMARIGDQWSVMGVVKRDHVGGNVGFQAAVKWSV